MMSRTKTQFSMLVSLALAALLGSPGFAADDPATAVPAATPASACAPATVVVVRHTEKADGPKGDPTLSELGHARAATIANLLSASQPTALWATHLQRTQQTLEPLAAHTGLPVQTLLADNTAGLVETLRARRDRLAVVAGHSNTVPEIVAGLGVGEPVVMTEADYDRLFVVTLGCDGQSSLLELRF
jgi:phosphohistidine phosphatase SixA